MDYSISYQSGTKLMELHYPSCTRIMVQVNSDEPAVFLLVQRGSVLVRANPRR